MRTRPLELQIISELLKDSRLSDKQLAETLRTFKTSVARARRRVEKQLIEGYTILPRWREIGLEIMAFAFFRSRKQAYLTLEKSERGNEKSQTMV